MRISAISYLCALLGSASALAGQSHAVPRNLSELVTTPHGYAALQHPAFREKMLHLLGPNLDQPDHFKAAVAAADRLPEGQSVASFLREAVTRAQLDSRTDAETAIFRELDRKFVTKPQFTDVRPAPARIRLSSERDLIRLLNLSARQLKREGSPAALTQFIRVTSGILRHRLLEPQAQINIGILAVAQNNYNQGLSAIPAVFAEAARSKHPERIEAIIRDLRQISELALTSGELRELQVRYGNPISNSELEPFLKAYDIQMKAVQGMADAFQMKLDSNLGLDSASD
jgi:hypothetical protein